MATLKIEQDYIRFRQIVRGKIKQDLRKYISHGELIGRKGKTSSAFQFPRSKCPLSASLPKARVASARVKAKPARRCFR